MRGVRTAVVVAVVALLAAPAAQARVVDGKRAKAFATRLAAAGPRVAGTANERRAARLVRERFESFGLPVVIQTFRLPNGNQSRNVVARTPGRLRTIVVAHMDGVSAGPAANDNGSGVAAMLEVAHVLRDTEGILFAAVGAEERQMTGSNLHLGTVRLLKSIPYVVRPRIRFAISLDMVGVGPTLNVRGLESAPNRSSRRALTQGRALSYGPRYLQDTGVSDHAELTRGGIPATYLTYRWDACWHSSCDRPSRLRATKIGNSGRLTVAALRAALR